MLGGSPGMISVHRPGMGFWPLMALLVASLTIVAAAEVRRRDATKRELQALTSQVRQLEAQIARLRADRQRADVQKARREARERILAERHDSGLRLERTRCQPVRCDPNDPLCGIH